MPHVIDTREPKLCHARPGDLVKITTEKKGSKVTEETYCMVVCNSEDKKQQVPENEMNGLYSVEAGLFLVDVTTGLAQRMPHLSTRLEIIRRDCVSITISSPFENNSAR